MFTKLDAFEINRSSMFFFRVGFEFDWRRPKSSKIDDSFRASPGEVAPGITSLLVSQSTHERLKSPARMMCPLVTNAFKCFRFSEDSVLIMMSGLTQFAIFSQLRCCISHTLAI